MDCTAHPAQCQGSSKKKAPHLKVFPHGRGVDGNKREFPSEFPASEVGIFAGLAKGIGGEVARARVRVREGWKGWRVCGCMGLRRLVCRVFPGMEGFRWQGEGGGWVQGGVSEPERRKFRSGENSRWVEKLSRSLWLSE